MLCPPYTPIWSGKLDNVLRIHQEAGIFSREIAIKENPADGTMVLQSSCLHSTSIHSLCTIRKLRFLHRVKTNEESICHRILYAAMVDDVEVLSLVCEYRELEGSDFTALIADYLEDTCVLRTAEKCIKQKDQALLLAEISKYQLIHKITMEIV